MKLLLRSPLSRRLFGVPLAIVFVVLCAVTAVAYFASSGAGSGSASSGSLQPVTVVGLTGGDTPSSYLFPGGSADVILRVSNQNSYSVTLVSAVGNGTITADPGHSLCTTTAVTFTDQPSLNITIPAGSSLIHLPGTASMGLLSSSGCQGATFSIPVSVTVHKG